MMDCFRYRRTNHMSIEINDQKPMDWIDDVVVTVPANGKEHHFIHSSTWLSQEQLESFDYDKTSLRVVGFFEHAQSRAYPRSAISICLCRGDVGPPKIPQFVRCDYTPRLNTTWIPQTGHFTLTGNAVIMTHGKVIPKSEDEGEKQQGDEGSEGNEERDPN